MPGTFVVDTAATFKSAMLVSAGPKEVFGAPGKQETNSQGIPKWTIEVAATFAALTPGMREQSELLTVTVTDRTNPAEGLNPGTPVVFDGFRVGSNAPEQGQNGRIKGGKLWYTATGLRSAHTASSRRSEAA